MERMPPRAFALPALLLLAATVLPPAAAAAVPADLHCGVDVVLSPSFGRLPAAGLERLDPSRGPKATQIILDAGPLLQANAQALATWQRAVDFWEARITDPVVITIAGDLQPLGADVLGSTASRTFLTDFTAIRDAMVADAVAGEAIAAQLPTLAQFTLLIPPGFNYAGRLSATKANLRALGFDMSFDDPEPDAVINFSTQFAPNFDYDPDDGIDSGKYDFLAIVIHEIGHALGFTSRVDLADFLRDDNQVDELYPTALDMYRLLPGAAAVDFTLAARVNTTGDIEPAHVVHDGTQDLGMSTGVNLGDGRQASHWKADELTGSYLGVMDPTISPGRVTSTTDNDFRLFGLIGWDVTDIVDCNDNGVDDAVDISGGFSEDCNGNGVPDECEGPLTATVAVPADFTTIQAAIDAAPADLCLYTVEVSPGVYAETIDFDGKPVVLRAVGGPQVTEIDATGLGGSAIVLVGGEPAVAAIEGFTVTGGDAPLGGGFFLQGTSPTLRDCIVRGNTAVEGGGLYVDGGAPRIFNSLFFDNSADVGAGLRVVGGATALLANLTVAANAAAVSGGGLSVQDADADLDNAVLWDNAVVMSVTDPAAQAEALGAGQLTIRYSTVLGGWAGPGEAVQTGDPLFVNAPAGDYRPGSGSPAIDAGDNDAVPPGVIVDLGGDPRFLDEPALADDGLGAAPVVDQGAYEHLPGLTDAPGRAPTPRSALLGVHPNPFNPSTTIAYTVARAGPVRLQVADLRGRLVRTLVDEPRPAGESAVRWDGRDAAGRSVAGGVYLVRLLADGFADHRKLMLLK